MYKGTFASFAGLIVFVLLLFLFVSGNNSAKVYNSERFGNSTTSGNSLPPIPQGYGKSNSVADLAPSTPDVAAGGIGDLKPSDPYGNEMYNQVVGGSPAQPSASCYPRDRLTATDLLPKDAANSRWSQMNPQGQGDVGDQNFLTAGYHVGIDTVGSSKRNGNLQLRSEPPNPQQPVSPWNISSIDPSDVHNRRPLEIGGDY